MPIAVTVDDREPDGLIGAVRDHPDVEAVSVERLSAGDIVVGPVAVERKTPRDYVAAAMGRAAPDLEAQVAAMAAAYPHAYVLVEGGFDDLEAGTGVSPASIRGSAASITARHGTPVVPCADRRRLVDYAIRLGRKHVEEPSRRALPAGAVPSRREPTAKRMYGCIEGIGPALADALYEAFPTVADLVAASRSELTAVEGIGEKRARAIRAALCDRPLETGADE